VLKKIIIKWKTSCLFLLYVQVKRCYGELCSSVLQSRRDIFLSDCIQTCLFRAKPGLKESSILKQNCFREKVLREKHVNVLG